MARGGTINRIATAERQGGPAVTPHAPPDRPKHRGSSRDITLMGESASSRFVSAVQVVIDEFDIHPVCSTSLRLNTGPKAERWRFARNRWGIGRNQIARPRKGARRCSTVTTGCSVALCKGKGEGEGVCISAYPRDDDDDDDDSSCYHVRTGSIWVRSRLLSFRIDAGRHNNSSPQGMQGKLGK